MKRLLLMGVVSAITGCGTTGSSTIIGAPDWPFELKDVCKPAGCDGQDALLAFNKSTQYCRDVGRYYERTAMQTSVGKVAIGWVGAIAGAVVAPVASPTAAKGWAGLSGAANGMQQQLTDAMSSTIALKKFGAISAYYESVNDLVIKETDPTKKVEKSIAMAATCAGKSSVVDAAALEAINSVKLDQKKQGGSGASHDSGSESSDTAKVESGSKDGTDKK